MRALIAMSGGVDSSAAARRMAELGYECVGCTMKLFDGDLGARHPKGDFHPRGRIDAEGGISTEEGALYPRGRIDAEGGFSTEEGALYPRGSEAEAEEESDAIADARSVTKKLGIPYYVLHYEDEFQKYVLEPFVTSYENGHTPNPCLECNRCLKFGKLYEKMEELGCDCLVTGHYAQIEYDKERGRWLLKKAADAAKDQSYFLYTLKQEQLAHVQFPMGSFTKSEAREFAAKAGFQNAERKDSQDICFVPDGDYAGFIERYLERYPRGGIEAESGISTEEACRYPRGREAVDGVKSSPGGAFYPRSEIIGKEGKEGKERKRGKEGSSGSSGNFVDKSGNVLGRHKGIIHYTLGQRRGLGIPAASRLYVVGIDPDANQVILGSNEDLFKTTLTASRVNLIAMPKIDGELRCKVKIRSRHKEQPATVTQIDEDTIRVVFDEPQRAITPGQAAVLYDGDIVLGGGIIEG